MSRNSSSLPIKGLVVANLDPAKKWLLELQVRPGLLVSIAAYHAEIRGFYSSLSTVEFFFFFLLNLDSLVIFIIEQLCAVG